MEARATRGAARPHFGPGLFEFLRELERHNDRAWFTANAERYRVEVREPLRGFVADVAPRLERIGPRVVADPRVGGSIVRIYRDMRFVRDDRPYRTTAIASFLHGEAPGVSGPGFWLHLGPRDARISAGLRGPRADVQRMVRAAIASDPAGWGRLRRRKAFRDGTLRLEGAARKRPPPDVDPDHKHFADLMRKEHLAICDVDETTACAPGFLAECVRTWRAAAPLVRFLAEATGLPW